MTPGLMTLGITSHSRTTLGVSVTIVYSTQHKLYDECLNFAIMPTVIMASVVLLYAAAPNHRRVHVLTFFCPNLRFSVSWTQKLLECRTNKPVAVFYKTFYVRNLQVFGLS
jgi:hypothetical protein